MSDSKREFDHDALHTASMLAEYLRALAGGIEAGHISLTDDQGDLSLSPQGLIRLRLRATQKSDRVRLGITLSWSRDPKSSNEAASLQISSSRK